MGEKKRLFAENTFIMTSATLIVKFMGLYLNVLSAEYLGAEGLGLYGLVMSVYMFASGLSVSGMTVAVTRISAQELAKGNTGTAGGVLGSCMLVSVSLSLIAALVMTIMSGVTAKYWIGDIKTVNSLCVAAMELPLISISAMLRGWYIAGRKALLPSLAQIFEQSVRLCACMIVLPHYAFTTADGCYSMVLCDFSAEFAGCALIVAFYLFAKKSESIKPDRIGRRIAEHAVPVTASHYITSSLRTAESSLIPTCLVHYGLSRENALAFMGIIHSMALPLLFFPASLLTAAGSLLTTEIVRYKTIGDSLNVRKLAEKAITLTLFCAIPVGMLFVIFSGEISMIIYGERRLIKVLAALAPLLPLMYCETVGTGILRGLGEQNYLLKYSAVDGILRISAILLLIPLTGTSGFMAIMIISNIFTPCLCIHRLKKSTGAAGFGKRGIGILLNAAVSAAVTLVCKKAISGLPDMADVVICGTIYIVIYLMLSRVSRHEREAAVHRDGLQIRKAVQCILCRQDRANMKEVRHVHRSR